MRSTGVLGRSILALVVAGLVALQPVATGAQVMAQWTQIATATAPWPRAQFGMAADTHGNVYVFGGRAPGNIALADFWRYNAATHIWQSLPSFYTPGLIEPHLAVDASGHVFEFGGIGNATFPHFSPDGHSYGLYEYIPAQNNWIDLTPAGPVIGLTWPPGREDFGFTYDQATSQFFVFAGEGQGDVSLNDLWSYDEQHRTWTQITQSYSGNDGHPIAPREIYALSDDYHGHLYLFGGSYLTPTAAGQTPPPYVNDLWRYTISTRTWSLVAGIANGYDPTMPLPRHYYGQACDPAGNFYILDGYLSDNVSPPFFANDLFSSYARDIAVAGSAAEADGYDTYALDDFWQYNRASGQWQDLSTQLGALRNSPAIPYVMVLDVQNLQFITFAGYMGMPWSTLNMTNNTWAYSLPPSAVGAPTTQPTTITKQPTPQ